VFEGDRVQSIDDVLTLVVLSLIVEVYENGIHNQLQVKQWDDR
jgi:hypothetical protein